MVTQIFEGAARALSKITKVEPAEGAKIYGGELLAYLSEIPIAFLTTKLGRKIFEFIIGTVGTVLAGRYLSGRAREDALEIFSHYLWKIIDPSPEDLIEIAEDLKKLKNAVFFGDWKEALRALVVPLDELKPKVEEIAGAFEATAAEEAPEVVEEVPSEISAEEAKAEVLVEEREEEKKQKLLL